MTQRDLAGLLNINVKTLRKWKKDRPKVYELLLIGLEAKNILSTLKNRLRIARKNDRKMGNGRQCGRIQKARIVRFDCQNAFYAIMSQF